MRKDLGEWETALAARLLHGGHGLSVWGEARWNQTLSCPTGEAEDWNDASSY